MNVIQFLTDFRSSNLFLEFKTKESNLENPNLANGPKSARRPAARGLRGLARPWLCPVARAGFIRVARPGATALTRPWRAGQAAARPRRRYRRRGAELRAPRQRGGSGESVLRQRAPGRSPQRGRLRWGGSAAEVVDGEGIPVAGGLLPGVLQLYTRWGNLEVRFD
jgi:hypothetical protein